jgi:release factor glutamine methyltransferase
VTISEHIDLAAEILGSADVAEPRREAESLLAFAIGRDRTFLIAHPEHEPTLPEELRFREFINRRAAREPLQYIIGRQEFYGLEFEVTPAVLIPRPETEVLVEHALRLIKADTIDLFCEIGVGSGCIAVALLANTPGLRAIGVDISDEALEIAGRNAARHNVIARLDLRRSDVFSSLEGERFGMIVSNPPYVPIRDVATLQREVGEYEPLMALTDNNDGLTVIRRIAAEAPLHLRPGGHLLLEIGFGQHLAVGALFDGPMWRGAAMLDDLQGIPRIVAATLTDGNQ